MKVFFLFEKYIVIQSYETLRCYSCQGEKQCDRMSFSSDSIEKKIVEGNDPYDSCSVSVNLYQ
jgi:hypothetical protein